MSSSPISSSSIERPGPAAAVAGSQAADLVLAAHDPLQPLFDVRCTVDVVIGTGVLTLRECLTLDRQHVVKLVEPAGGDLSIRVHGITVGTGEVVVVDNAAALRVTRVVPPAGVEAA